MAGGALHQIWPGPIQDMPDDLARAISHAATIIRWQDNVMPDDMPPEWSWSHDEFLNEWFEQVRANRETNRPTFDIEGDVMENELAPKGIR